MVKGKTTLRRGKYELNPIQGLTKIKKQEHRRNER